jgi:hypothetical protein
MRPPNIGIEQTNGGPRSMTPFAAHPDCSADYEGIVRHKALVVALGVLLGGCVGPFSEDFESHYADVGAARQDGAFDRGWLPAIIPEDATVIWEMHNMDTNLTWACFATPQGPASTRAFLEKHGAERVSGPISDGPRRLFAKREWWPSSMAEAQIEAYELKESSRFTLVIGVEPAGRRVCFHRS